VALIAPRVSAGSLTRTKRLIVMGVNCEKMNTGSLARTLETFALHEGHWIVIRLFKDQDTVSVAPFTDIRLDLTALWLGSAE
jgi:hypothetical protein